MQAAQYFNNGQPLTNLADFQVELLVRRNLPEKTYSSIGVNTVEYQFPGAPGLLRSREITLVRTALDVGWESFKAFFSGMFLGAQLPSHTVLDHQLVAQGVLGNPSGKAEVKKAFATCHNIKLILSDDCNYLQIEIAQARFLILARRIGQAASPILYKLLEDAQHYGLPLILGVITKLV